MHDLKAITPLGRSGPVAEVHGPVTITEVTNVALASVAARRGRAAETRAELKHLLGGAPLPRDVLVARP